MPTAQGGATTIDCVEAALERYATANGDDPLVTGGIALDHLTEFADDYTRLAALEREARAVHARLRRRLHVVIRLASIPPAVVPCRAGYLSIRRACWLIRRPVRLPRRNRPRR
jgi:hypothetical protein